MGDHPHFWFPSDQEEGKEFQEIQGMNLNPRKLYLMFGLEKP